MGPAVAPLALVLIAYPAISILLPGLSDQILLGTSILLMALSLNRYVELGWPTLWLFALLIIYLVRIPTGIDQPQGVVHTLALLATGVAFLTFAVYGSTFLDYPAFTPIFIFVLLVDMAVIISADLQKNAASAQLTYVGALGAILLLRRASGSHLRVAVAFYIYVVIAAFSFGTAARGLAVVATLFLVMVFAAARLKPRTYWLLGITGSVNLIVGTIWFFTGIRSSQVASGVARFVEEISGERAETGRQFLWPYVLDLASANPFFGLGAGALPRQYISTTLSSHNYYLQVYLQVGLLGLAVLIAFLMSVWTLAAYAKTPAGQFGSAIFIAFVLQNATEVAMFQNNTNIAIPAWCAIGLALSIERGQQRGFVIRPGPR